MIVMRPNIAVGCSLVLTILMLAPAAAHSLREFETSLAGSEKYFQPIDKDAPAFTLQDADGRAVLHFIYTNCPDVCPLHTERIAEIQDLINQSPVKQQVEFISITTDPSRDKGDVLRNYGHAHGLDPANWVFLTPKSDQPEDITRALAERFGHRFDKTEDGYQIHGIVTHVIDKEGRWRANFHGLQFEPTNLVVFVNALVNDIEKPHGHDERSLWDKLRGLFGS